MIEGEPSVRLPVSADRGLLVPPELTCPATSIPAKVEMHFEYSLSMPMAEYALTAESTFETFFSGK